MPRIVSMPRSKENWGSNKRECFGFHKLQNERSSQEDALVFETFCPEELVSKGKVLTPQEIAHRLWTTYRLLDKEFIIQPFEAGTTASTTLYDGHGNLITATLADSASFVAIYNKKGEAIAVTRLNSLTHTPNDLEEKQRIEESGGKIYKENGMSRVEGSLAISRAIGDSSFKKVGVCSQANIDIINLDNLIKNAGIPYDEVGLIQLISCSDGFTDGAADRTKKAQETFLLEELKKFNGIEISEEALAIYLVNTAQQKGSVDNISVAVKTLTKDSAPCLVGIYDGHAGDEASAYVANNIGLVLRKQCALDSTHYAAQVLSVNQNEAVYKRDNAQIEKNSFSPKACILEHLLTSDQRLTRCLPMKLPRLARIPECKSLEEKLDKVYKDSQSGDVIAFHKLYKQYELILDEANENPSEEIQEALRKASQYIETSSHALLQVMREEPLVLYTKFIDNLFKKDLVKNKFCYFVEALSFLETYIVMKAKDESDKEKLSKSIKELTEVDSEHQLALFSYCQIEEKMLPALDQAYHKILGKDASLMELREFSKQLDAIIKFIYRKMSSLEQFSLQFENKQSLLIKALKTLNNKIKITYKSKKLGWRILKQCSTLHTHIMEKLTKVPSLKEEAISYLKHVLQEIRAYFQKISLEVDKKRNPYLQEVGVFTKGVMNDLAEEIKPQLKMLLNEDSLYKALLRAQQYHELVQTKYTFFHQLSHCFFKDLLVWHKICAVEALLIKLKEAIDEKKGKSLGEMVEEIKEEYPRCEAYFISQEFTKMLKDIQALEINLPLESVLLN